MRKRKAGVEDSLADETGTERRERESSEEQAAALMGLMRCFEWLAIVVSVILGVTIFCLVWNHQENGGLIWIALVGLFVTAAVAGLCWQRRRDLKKEIG